MPIKKEVLEAYCRGIAKFVGVKTCNPEVLEAYRKGMEKFIDGKG
jgi:hypothetical protein